MPDRKRKTMLRREEVSGLGSGDGRLVCGVHVLHQGMGKADFCTIDGAIAGTL